MLQTPPLIGRERDLAVGLEQLKRIEQGGSASVLIRGEAGIGKTRLATELASRAEQLGHRVLVGRADDFDRGIPYALFRDMLARFTPPARGAKGIEQVLREFREGLDADLGQVFTRAVELFRTLTAGAPTVLHVDDAHLADADSLALLAQIARLGELPMLTVITSRLPVTGPARDLERLMVRMTSEGRGAVIELAPLDRSDVKSLVGAALGAVPDERVVDAALDASGGNPFFAHESVRALDYAGALSVEEGRARLVLDAAGLAPDAALLARVFGGDEEATELAKVVSAFGRISLRHLPLAARLTGRDEALAEETFDRLAREHVLERDLAGSYEFSHSIVRDAVYAEIGPAERRRLHAAIADELARDRRAGALLDIAELATHVAESADPGDERAVEILLEAAEAAAATAPLVAAEHYGRAVELLPSDSPQRYVALARRARALHIGGRPLDAGAAGREALKGLEQGPQRAATVATVINGLNIAGRMAQALDVVEAELADGGDPCPLLAQRVHLLLSAGRPADAAEQLPEALAAIEAAPVQAQLIGVQHLLIYATDVGKQALADEMTERLEAWAEEGPDARRLTAHETIALLDRRVGVVSSLEYHLAEAAALSPDVGLPSFGGHRELAQAHVHYLRGEWDEVLGICRAMAFDLDQAGVALVAQLFRTLECEILISRGVLDEAGRLADALSSPIEELISQVVVCRARIARALGESEKALDALERQAVRSAERRTTMRRPELLVELAEIYLELGRAADAREISARATEEAREPARFEAVFSAAYLRALVGADAKLAQEYLDLAERERVVPERARALLLLGELDADPLENLTAAYRAFDDLGASPWRRRAATALRTRGLTVPRPAKRSDGVLTDSEAQLVRLVREGMTNRQIASALNYSPKTVEAYLSRIYAKTECGSRVELVRALDSGAVELPES